MLEDWTYPSFANNKNTTFTVQHPQWGNVPMQLISVSELRETPRQRAFSIVFLGPLDRPLEQGLHTMSHETMGTETLFIVPIGRDADGFQYEAVFNNLVK